MNEEQIVQEKLDHEKAKFNGCYRDTKGKMVKKEVAESNGWRVVGKDGKATPTDIYWNYRKQCLIARLTPEQQDSLKEQLAKRVQEADQAKLAEAKNKKRELAKEIKEEKKRAKQEALEAYRAQERAKGIAEENLPRRLPRDTDYGTYKGLQSPYGQKRRSGYRFIWQVLAENPDTIIPWDKLQKEAVARFKAEFPEYIAKNYGPDHEYDVRTQVGVMDRSPYNAPVEKVGQRVIRNIHGAMLVSDTKGVSYEDYQADKKAKAKKTVKA